jgi:hypothetical protein
MQKQEIIELVNQSAGSLFTKEDVINLLNKFEETPKSNINFEELKDRIEAIIDEADDEDIEVNTNRCEFYIQNGNEIQVEDIKFETDTFRGGIQHDICELINSVERGEACQVEEETTEEAA